MIKEADGVAQGFGCLLSTKGGADDQAWQVREGLQGDHGEVARS